MDDDIVTRLRTWHDQHDSWQTFTEAADEIEWLRETVEHWKGNANALTDWVLDLKKQLGYFDEDED